MSEEKRTRDIPGKTSKPELQPARYEWPGLITGPGADMIIYKPPTRRPGELPQAVQTVPTIWMPSTQASWQYTGLNESTLAVKRFNYTSSNTNDNDDAPISQHIHEHHHYTHRYPITNQLKPMRYERHGYLVKMDPNTMTAPPLPFPNQDAGMFRSQNQRIENGTYYPQFGPHLSTCPYYTGPEYTNACSQPQVMQYPEVNAVDQHYHIHQHYYHPQYQYQPVKYQQSQFCHPHQPRLVGQQPRFHVHQHTAQFPYHPRPYFAYNDGYNWFSQGPLPRPSYSQNDYDLSALKEVLRTL